jgi:hypothetical protein
MAGYRIAQPIIFQTAERFSNRYAEFLEVGQPWGQTAGVSTGVDPDENVERLSTKPIDVLSPAVKVGTGQRTDSPRLSLACAVRSATHTLAAIGYFNQLMNWSFHFHLLSFLSSFHSNIPLTNNLFLSQQYSSH